MLAPFPTHWRFGSHHNLKGAKRSYADDYQTRSIASGWRRVRPPRGLRCRKQVSISRLHLLRRRNPFPLLHLLPGLPRPQQRIALIDTFKEKSAGLEKQYEARVYKSDLTMPYRLFRPAASAGKLPLVLYLHGSGGLGDDNQKQLGLGNVFGTRVWLLPENQKKFPCYVVVPQTDTGWVHYDLSREAQGVIGLLPGLGDGARLALGIIDALCREFAIDERRIYVTGQSMGGAGTWHMTAQRPKLFAAAVACCAVANCRGSHRIAGHSPVELSRQLPTSRFLWLCHATASQRCGKPAASLCTPSTLVSTITCGSGLTPNRSW